MQAYKVSGKIDETGRLIVTEAIALHPGDVEVILLQAPSQSLEMDTSELAHSQELTTDPAMENIIPGLKQWLQESPKVSHNYDPDQAKWEYLQEKYDL